MSAWVCRDMCTHVRAHNIEIKQTLLLAKTFGCVLIILVKQVGDTQQICDEKVFFLFFFTLFAIKNKKNAEVITV